MEPLVSVCMTTYNHEPYLVEAIEGVLMQRAPFGVELVLGEDCSTDGTAVICRAYAERWPDRVRLVTGPCNVGWRANYRRTLAACRGRYVAFCDGDDRWTDPDKLRRQVERLESVPSCGMCFTRTVRYYPATGRREPYPSAPPADPYTAFGDLWRRWPVDNCSTLARRDLIEDYYAEVRPAEHPEWLTDDAPMWLWFAARHGICFLDAVTAEHRVLTGSVSHGADRGRRLAFNDSIWGIHLWFDARYGGGRHRRQMELRRHTDALWLLGREGSAGECLRRWGSDVRRTPWLLLWPVGAWVAAKGLLGRAAAAGKEGRP